MSFVSLSQRYIALAVGNTLNVFCRNTAKLLFKYECDGKDILQFQQTQISKSNNNKNKNNNPKINENEESKESKNNNKNKNNNNNNKNKSILINHIVYSSKHDCFVIVTDDKYIRILINHNNDKDEDQDIDLEKKNDDNNNDESLYHLHRYKKMDKKISSICLSPIINNDDEEYLLTADKFGVIYIHYLPALTIKYDGAGHLSIISHITFDSEGKYLMSADKDFKIRISRFPQIYIIDGFCYGHTQAVTKCVAVNNTNHKNTKYIISGSVDQTIKIWSIPSGKQLKTFKFKPKQIEENKSNDDKDEIVFDIECNLDGLDTLNGYKNMIKNQPLIITDIKYFEKGNIIAVAFNRSSRIYLFGLDLTDKLKPNLKSLNSFDLVTDSKSFNGLYDMLFDENGNVMTMFCCKESDENVYLSLDVFILSNNGLSVQSAKNNIIIEMIQKQIKETCHKMESFQVIPLFMGLLRNWEIGGERKKKHKSSNTYNNNSNNSNNSNNKVNDQENDNTVQPPIKKRKISTEDEETFN